MAAPTQFRAEVEVFGVSHSVEKLTAMGARAMNTLPLMEMIKELLFEQQRARVQSAPWAPLADSTITRKASQDEDVSIFRDEWRPIGGKATRVGNKLYLALTLDGATGQIKRATRTTATFGVQSKGNQQLFYARFAQNVKGTHRQILGISDDDALGITERVGNWIYVGESALKR